MKPTRPLRHSIRTPGHSLLLTNENDLLFFLVLIVEVLIVLGIMRDGLAVSVLVDLLVPPCPAHQLLKGLPATLGLTKGLTTDLAHVLAPLIIGGLGLRSSFPQPSFDLDSSKVC